MKDAAAEMEPGTMIHSEWFNLYEAMSALELMDPKMDAGTNRDEVSSPEERLQQGARLFSWRCCWSPCDFVAGELRLELTPKEVLAICDNLLGLELLWYDGNSLAQTLFTCLYIHPAVLKKLQETQPM